MSDSRDNPYARLERVFHEPGRLAIMSGLLGAPNGLTFTELKKSTGLTDGNLNRHLKTLAEASVVAIRKRIVKNRPQTLVVLSRRGRKDFLAYLEALEAVLLDAAGKAGDEARTEPNPPLFGLPVSET
mgnify:FL=1